MRVQLISVTHFALLALCESFSPDSDALFGGNSRDPFWRNETEVVTLLHQWPEARIRRFLALRGQPGGDSVPRDELIALASAATSEPIITSLSSPSLADSTESQCAQLTVDQLVYWASRYSGRRVNSHGANVFDAPPTLVRSQAKRTAAVELCRRLFRERVHQVKMPPPRDLSEGPQEPIIQANPSATTQQQRDFSAQIAEAESAPHVFEPDINPALDRAAKHSIHDLRALLDVFGVAWSTDESHQVLTERAKAHTRLWSGPK